MVAYATMLGERAGVDVSEVELEGAGVLARYVGHTRVSVRQGREMLAPITEFVEKRAGETFTREVTADYRAVALMHADVLDPGASAPDIEPEHRKPPDRFLDSEIVALYW